MADIKHPRHEEALSGVKASKARLLSEAEACRKDKPQELATKKMQAATEETCEPEPVTAADDFKIDFKAAARDALKRRQQELVTKEIEQKVKLELENEKLQEQLNTFEATEVEETKAPSSLNMKLNVISGQRFGMVAQGSKIQSIISVAGHQVIGNLSEPSEFTLMHLDTYADYLRQVEPRTESRAVRALLTTGGPRMKKLHGRYLEVYGPYQVMLNVDGVSIYTRTYVTTDSDQMCYVDDVVIATPTLEDHIDQLDEVFGCMKRAGLKCKPSKCEILRDSIKYLGRMVDRHCVRPDPEAVEAVLT